VKTETINGAVHVTDGDGLAAVVVELPDGAGWGAAVRGRSEPVAAPSLDQALAAVERELQRPATPAARQAQSAAEAREEHRAAWRRDVGGCAGDPPRPHHLLDATRERMARADAEARGVAYAPPPPYEAPRVAEAPAAPPAPSDEELLAAEIAHRRSMRELLGNVAGGMAQQHRFFRRRDGSEQLEHAVAAAIGKGK
jgi:hypothetical protein